MQLNNLRLLPGGEQVSIETSDELISRVSPVLQINNTGITGLDLDGCTAFPGLINSHDHLDFNCYPMLGNGGYKNYTEWGKQIHEQYKDEINAVLKIPVALRTQWGVYKNLLAGVTTVINHGDLLNIENSLIDVRQDFQNLHSVKFEKKWKWKLNNPLHNGKLCVIHTGEGVDENAANEIVELLKWNLINRKLVGVHAVSMNAEQAKKFEAIVWCPESNKFLLNRMAAINNLKQHTNVLFGTDSTLTGDWNIWKHLRLAKETEFATGKELFDMLTITAAKVWGLNAGEIAIGKRADIVVTKKLLTGNDWDDLLKTDPKDIILVMQKGRIRLFDESILHQLQQLNIVLKNYSTIVIDGSLKYVEADLPGLMKSIKSHYPAASFPFDEYKSTSISSHA